MATDVLPTMYFRSVLNYMRSYKPLWGVVYSSSRNLNAEDDLYFILHARAHPILINGIFQSNNMYISTVYTVEFGKYSDTGRKDLKLQ